MAYSGRSAKSMGELRRIRKRIEEPIDWRIDDDRGRKRSTGRYHRGNLWNWHREREKNVTSRKKQRGKESKCT